MNNVNAGNLLAQSGERLRRCDCLIDGARALAASEDQQGGCVLGFLRNRKERLAHGNASYLAVRKILARFFEVDRGGGDPARDHSIGESGNDVGFESERWKAASNRGYHRGSG